MATENVMAIVGQMYQITADENLYKINYSN